MAGNREPGRLQQNFPAACELTAELGVFIRVILAVIVTIANPALWYAVTR